MSIKAKGIKELRERLKKLKSLDQTEIVMAVAKHGAKLAQDACGENAVVTYEEVGDGKARIVANGSKIAFIEFGIGTEGEGQYQGQLPTQDITFYSEKDQKEHTTKGWVYNYFAKEKRNENPDTNVKDVKGFVAIAPMWKTANKLGDGEAANAIKQYLDEKGV